MRRLAIPRQQLAADEVHIWHLFVDDIADSGLLGQLGNLLAPEEKARQARYARERDRRQFFLARVLARTVLASYLERPCESLHFSTTPYGKPVLPPYNGTAGIHFNLTHSHGAIACAVSTTREVGIDVEEERRTLAYLDLAERYFAPPEAQHLRGLDTDMCRSAFFSIWTLKEAFVKALGQGLTYPLDTFSFDLDADRLCAFRPLHGDVSPHWQFFQFQLGPCHRGALAVQGEVDRPIRVQMHDWATRFLQTPAERSAEAC